MTGEPLDVSRDGRRTGPLDGPQLRLVKTDPDPHDEKTKGLFNQLHGPDLTDGRRREVRNHLVELHLHHAERIARQFHHRGESPDDVRQVAVTGLIEAVDRFDPARGAHFLAFAVPTITGVIRRHFRDHAWLMNVPRRLKQLHRPLEQARVELTQRYGRAPTVRELAVALRVSADDVAEAIEVSNAYTALSLEIGLPSDDVQSTWAMSLGGSDDDLEAVDDREALRTVLPRLPPQEKTILFLRFFRDQTQTQIGDHLGISQVHVSRLLGRTLARLREQLVADI